MEDRIRKHHLVLCYLNTPLWPFHQQEPFTVIMSIDTHHLYSLPSLRETPVTRGRYWIKFYLQFYTIVPRLNISEAQSCCLFVFEMRLLTLADLDQADLDLVKLLLLLFLEL